jgi:DNA-binding transcriptional regulator YdaS (Cro superfamily)
LLLRKFTTIVVKIFKITTEHFDMTPLEKAIDIIAHGNKSEFTRLLRKESGLPLSQQLVSHWVLKSKKGCSGTFAIAIESLTKNKVTREQLRPDIFKPKKIRSVA